MNNSYYIYSEILNMKAQQNGVPLAGTFELTARCNFNCRMCYIHKNCDCKALATKEKTAYEWLKLAEECRDAGTLNLLLTGGEPLVRRDFKEIYKGLRSMGFILSMNTNGSLIDDGMLEFFSDYPPNRINISLYGASEQTYERLCGNGKAYEKTLRAIKELNKNNITVKLNYSATPYNICDARKVFEFADENKIPLQSAYYMFPPERANEYGTFSSERFSPSEAADAKFYFDGLKYNSEERREKYEKLLNGAPIDSEKMNCRAGSTTFWVTWNGRLRMCGMTSEPDIELVNGQFKTNWNKLRQERSIIERPIKCRNCKVSNICDACAAISYAESGSFTGVPVYMCELTENYISLIKNFLKGEDHESI